MFNNLNAAQIERLAIMSEELSELATIGHYINSTHLQYKGMDLTHIEASNLELLEIELADCLVAIDYLEKNKDLDVCWYKQNATSSAYTLLSNKETPFIQNIGHSLLHIGHQGIKIINKTIRHGYDSYNPFDQNRTTNRELLTKWLIDLNSVKTALILTNTINTNNLLKLKEKKFKTILKYLHEQDVLLDSTLSLM